MSLMPQFEDDIFISYSHADNASFDPERQGWVDTLHERLAIRLPQLLGTNPRIYRDTTLPGNDLLTGNLVFKLSNTAILIAVLTPAYIRSDWCMHELREFYRRASENGGLVFQGRARIFKVLKSPVPYDEQPPELRDLPSYNFYEEEAYGTAKELSSDIGAGYDIRYWEKFDRLAHDIKAFLEYTHAPNEYINHPYLNTSSYAVITKEGTTRLLKVFLCHASDDKPSVRLLYERLCAENIDPWIDEENLLPGQYWEQEIPKAVRNSDAVIVCLSQASINKRGYIQKEIKYALDLADEQPEGVIFLIPLRLQNCDVTQRLQPLQWVDYFHEKGHERLMRALRARASTLNVMTH